MTPGGMLAFKMMRTILLRLIYRVGHGESWLSRSDIEKIDKTEYMHMGGLSHVEDPIVYFIVD